MTLYNRYTIFFFILSALLFSKVSYADIYKWVDENGVIHFSDDKSLIPVILLDKVEKIKPFKKEGIKEQKEVKTKELEPISFEKDEEGFDGVVFGTELEKFLEAHDGAYTNDKDSKKKRYMIGDGQRLIGGVKVKVEYIFDNDDLTGVKIAYTDTDEKELIKELLESLGDPDFKRHPFIYWINDTIERRVRKDEDTFYILKKKIKNF